MALHPRLARAGPADVTPSDAPAASPVPVGHAPPALGASESDWPAQAALLFLFTVGLLGLVLALAPAACSSRSQPACLDVARTSVLRWR